MATARKKLKGYEIRQFVGIGSDGRRIDKQRTWYPAEGMTPKQIEKELEKQKLLFEQEVLGSSTYCDGNLRFREMAKKWMDDYARVNLSPSTYGRNEDYLKRINTAIGHKKLKDLKPLHLNAFYANLAEPGMKQDCKGKPIKGAYLAPKTILEHHRLISSILSYAVKWQLIGDNVARFADPPKVPYKEISHMDEVQIKRLMNLLEGAPIQYRTMIKLLIYTGMRRGELMGLEWKDISLSTGQIRIVRTSQYIGNKTVITKEPKTQSGRREFTLSSSACKMLTEYKRYYDGQRELLGDLWVETDRLFIQWNGVAMYPDTISGWFSDFIRKNGFSHVTLHSLRHSNATLMIAGGVDVCTVSKRLGHANTSTTLNIYAHALKSRDIEAAEKLDSTLAI